MVQQRDFQSLEARVMQLEALIGEAPETSQRTTIHARLREIDESLGTIRHSVEEIGPFVEERISSYEERDSDVREFVDLRIDELLTEIQVLKRAVATGPGDGASGSKLRVPEPKHFEGDRSSKVLENFLWDIEEYFKATHVPDREKVSIAGMYLSGDAKLWWRSRRTEDARCNREPISSWENFTRELKNQFLPCNTSWIARDALKKLKHTGSVRDYVKDFTSLMLEIEGMAEEDKLFNFVSGLQPWAQTELKRQRVQDLATALSSAEALIDYKAVGDPKAGQKKKDAGKGKEKEKKGGGNKNWRKKKDGDHAAGNPKESNQAGGDKKRGCFICNGDHRMRECPQRSKLNALMANDPKPAEEGPRMNPLQLLSALQGEDQSRNGLMYLKVLINGKQVMAMVDSGATHNFIAIREVKTLGLELAAHTSRIKAVNSEAKPIQGVSNVELQVGSWKGPCTLMAVPLDDFDVILGNDFLRKAKVAVMPHLGGVLVCDETSPSYVADIYSDEAMRGKGQSGMISAMQLKNGIK